MYTGGAEDPEMGAEGHTGTFIQVLEASVNVAARPFNRRQAHVTPCGLPQTKALCEISNFLGWSGSGCIWKALAPCSEPAPFPSALNCRTLGPTGLDPLQLWGEFICWVMLLGGHFFPTC